LADEAGVVAYGGLKIYDFPQGYIYMQSAVADLAITKSSAGVNDDWDGDIGLGTVTASNNATLAATEQNIISTTATPQAAAGATTGDGVSTATEHAILDGTSAAVDLFVNLLVDDADHDVTSTPCNLILNGTITVNWLFMGDN
jgi:type II secretory pathway component GspD/PulD (secretin)